MNKKAKLLARPQPDGNGHQVSYETAESRRVHRFPLPESTLEQVPHGAGSYHDPEHHHKLIDRVEAYLREQS